MKKNDFGNNSLHLSFTHKNLYIMKLLIKYADENNIILEINEEEDKNGIIHFLMQCLLKCKPEMK